MTDQTPKTVEMEFKNALAHTGVFKLNGEDISSQVCGVTVDAQVGELIEINLNLLARKGVHFKGSAFVGVAAETAQILRELGWTPPKRRHVDTTAIADSSRSCAPVSIRKEDHDA